MTQRGMATRLARATVVEMLVASLFLSQYWDSAVWTVFLILAILLLPWTSSRCWPMEVEKHRRLCQMGSEDPVAAAECLRDWVQTSGRSAAMAVGALLIVGVVLVANFHELRQDHVWYLFLGTDIALMAFFANRRRLVSSQLAMFVTTAP
jgi:hypothetical protein